MRYICNVSLETGHAMPDLADADGTPLTYPELASAFRSALGLPPAPVTLLELEPIE